MEQHIKCTKTCKRVYEWNIEKLNTFLRRKFILSSEKEVRWHLPRKSCWDSCLAQAEQCVWNNVTERGHLIPQSTNDPVQKFTAL